MGMRAIPSNTDMDRLFSVKGSEGRYFRFVGPIFVATIQLCYSSESHDGECMNTQRVEVTVL